ncbi:hypothetical protein VNO77_03391 [Canavalia gladiata]|uniref:Uncharacterized protein n=1 Tax=Canavalia gladiata TaxID=3824 RepID=A0AAN9R3U6_CANGL
MEEGLSVRSWPQASSEESFLGESRFLVAASRLLHTLLGFFSKVDSLHSGKGLKREREKTTLVLAQLGVGLSREGELHIGYTQNESMVMDEMMSYLSFPKIEWYDISVVIKGNVGILFPQLLRNTSLSLNGTKAYKTGDLKEIQNSALTGSHSSITCT